MRAFSILLTVLAAILPAAASSEEPRKDAEPVQAVLDRVAKMGPAEQQAWLRQLEDRALRAAGLTPDPNEAAQRQAKIRTMLHQETVTWQVLRQVIEEAAGRERAAAAAALPKTQPAVKSPPQPQPNKPEVPLRVDATKPTPEKPKAPAVRPVEPERVAQEKPKALAPLEEEPSIDEVEIKVDELAARIAGCNLAIRALETDLTEKGPWTAARLKPLVDRLKILAIRRNDLDLFREAVPEETRASVARLESPKTAVSRLGARIAEARGLASGAEFSGTGTERQAELQRLDELSRGLAGAAGK
jgi:hypothetical protein